MVLKPTDLEITNIEMVGENVKLLRLQPGDLLLCQPQKELSQQQTDSVHRQLDHMVPDTVKVCIIPHTWKINIARVVPQQEVIDNLLEMRAELEG